MTNGIASLVRKGGSEKRMGGKVRQNNKGDATQLANGGAGNKMGRVQTRAHNEASEVGFGSPLKQHVWGIYIDELLQQRLLTTINNHGAGDYFPLSDLLYRTTALTDSAANIIETYDTDAYGNTLIFTAPGTAENWWADDAVQSDNATCEFIFTGRRRDSESSMYFFRTRYYGALLGRLVARDLRLYRGSKWNLYEFVRSRPLSWLDPMGHKGICYRDWTKMTIRWTTFKDYATEIGETASIGGTDIGKVIHVVCRYEGLVTMPYTCEACCQSPPAKGPWTKTYSTTIEGYALIPGQNAWFAVVAEPQSIAAFWLEQAGIAKGQWGYHILEQHDDQAKNQCKVRMGTGKIQPVPDPKSLFKVILRCEKGAIVDDAIIRK
jgi:RHS repeat-associated protein